MSVILIVGLGCAGMAGMWAYNRGVSVEGAVVDNNVVRMMDDYIVISDMHIRQAELLHQRGKLKKATIITRESDDYQDRIFREIRAKKLLERINVGKLNGLGDNNGRNKINDNDFTKALLAKKMILKSGL